MTEVVGYVRKVFLLWRNLFVPQAFTASAVNAAIGQVKTLINPGNDISSMGRQLGAILTAEETLLAQGDSKKKSLFS